MRVEDYVMSDATELVRRVKAREVTAGEILDAALVVLERVEPAVNAFCALSVDVARAAATSVDKAVAAGGNPGALAGVPVGIKDLIFTKDIRTTFGSRLYADFIPDADDVIVERLKAAGALILGKTTTFEFGFGTSSQSDFFPPTRNPWDLALTPGGSSLGTAAAVAARICPIAIGTDGGGSIRIPAAFSGLVGVKASMGRVPLWPGCRDARYPGASGWETLAHIGPLTRSVRDAALALDIIAGPDPRDRLSIPTGDVDWKSASSASLPGGLRVAYWPQWHGEPVDPDVRRAVDHAVEMFTATSGAEVTVCSPPTDDLLGAFEVLVALETDLVGLKAAIAEDASRFTGPLRDFIVKPRSADEFIRTVTARKEASARLIDFMGDFHVLLTPTVSILPFPIASTGPEKIGGAPVGRSGWTPFTFPFNLTGQPAASVPCGRTASGLPVGIQIVAAPLHDAIVLSVAAAFEKVLPWREHVPAIVAERILQH